MPAVEREFDRRDDIYQRGLHVLFDEPVIDQPQYDHLLDIARLLHKNKYCAKDVHAADIIRTPIGKISLFARNALPFATHSHGVNYRVENLIARAELIPPEEPERPIILDHLRGIQSNAVTDCGTIYQSTGMPLCIKGLNFEDVHAVAKRETDPFCPNSTADGCAERALIYWTPYALALQDELKAQHLIISRMAFDGNGGPVVTYWDDESEHPRRERVTTFISPSDVPDLSQTFVSSITPCNYCVEPIIGQGVKDLVVGSFTKYEQNGQVIVDETDVMALGRMAESGIRIYCTSSARPVLRT